MGGGWEGAESDEMTNAFSWYFLSDFSVNIEPDSPLSRLACMSRVL